MEHTKGELRLIRSPKYPGNIFIKIKGTERKFLCKFYGGKGTEISPVEAEANVCHFVQYWNEIQDKGTSAESKYGREPFKSGVMQICNGCVFQNKAVVSNCCSPIACKHQQREMKPLAQYLDEYIEHEIENGNVSQEADELYAWDSWRELLKQALDAYESTENVKIKIERV